MNYTKNAKRVIPLNKIYQSICENELINNTFVYDEFDLCWKKIETNGWLGFGVTKFPESKKVNRDVRPRVLRVRPTMNRGTVNRMKGQITVHIHMVYCK